MTYQSPVYQVISVPVEKIQPNTYNPNSVAPPELKLLYDSIKEDGYTMPIVCYHDDPDDTYIIVDGFHRCEAMKQAGMRLCHGADYRFDCQRGKWDPYLYHE